MKKHLCFLLLLASCTVRRPVPGTYYSNETTYIKSLKLDVNGTFVLFADNFQRKTSFLGMWKYLSKDTILLKYNLKDFPAIAASEHIRQAQVKVILLNNGEIKYDQGY
ncbi:hypothetical protein HK413_08410 [Mucilaginibacter sp. S1162]|uniref:Lipoprotein n=1 Tax=Mucilaginibacter humi TaxID=2732510 RepID=A0ABX1W754_9SPHI|nr:hypothetical protein [Mucilaginibacter humi]NNU34162.1 hypothetical protein [Mucilaginibacter humi]